MKPANKGRRQMALIHAVIYSSILLVGYVVIYQRMPFPEPWNTIVLNIATSLSAGFAALMATLILKYFEKDESPHKVWKNLMIACWLWFAGEVLWSMYVLLYGVAPLGLFDITWVVGFIYFTLALYQQHAILFPAKKVFLRNISIFMWIMVLLLPIPVVLLTEGATLKTYMDFFYPFADLAVGVAGILLLFSFQGGAMMRPWIGLVVFGVTDYLYAWAEQTGIYAWSVDKGNLLSLFIDTSYTAAYIILALGFLAHWTLLRYGINEIQIRK
ncbi:MAG: hypothetical protein HY867_20540 [Chloroflexi bacterium]|nr:hypothetical protein [Chloroflexota bacterium]